jgi:hypothetical protein
MMYKRWNRRYGCFSIKGAEDADAGTLLDPKLCAAGLIASRDGLEGSLSAAVR